MKDSRKCTLLFPFVLLLLTLPLCAFDWPQELIIPHSFSSYFAQKRGSSFSTSLIFTGSVPVKASDSGRVIVRIDQNSSSFISFPSTLGNAVILSHKDSLMTVYASLDSIQITADRKEITAGEELGISGNSGWHTGPGCLEFQVIDVKNKTCINPLLLMPSISANFDLQLGKLFIADKKGTMVDLSIKKSFESGMYILYRDAASGGMPYKTSVTVNGALVQTITYDALSLYEQQLCVSSKKNLPYSEVYPQDTLQYLAELHLNKGKNSITVQVFDILGNQKQSSFNVEVF